MSEQIEFAVSSRRLAQLLSLLPFSAVAAVTADEGNTPPPQSLDQVVVVGKRSSDTDARRYSTAAKMVFGREELGRYGDSSLGDVLKRLPGVTMSGTPGRGGDVRMRGLGNGYTQILINGEPAPRGFSMDSLAPEQVERIEVMRAPVAEFSTRAMAGTINIVLREKFVKTDSEARVSLGTEGGRLQPSLHLGKSDGNADFDYNFHASPSRRNQQSVADTISRTVDPATGTTSLEQRLHDESRSVTDGIHASGRLNWKLGGGDSVSINPFLMQSRTDTSGHAHLDQSIGATPASYADANYRTIADSTLLRLMGNWRVNLGESRRLDVRFNGGLANSDSTTSRHEFDAGGLPVHDTATDKDIRDANFSTAGKYSSAIGQGHNLAYGWELEQGKRKESATVVQDGVQQLAQYGNSVEARTRRLAAFAQDEWDVSPLWSVYGGLRWESIRTESRWAANSVDNDSSVLSPLLHGVWRFTEESRDQVRLGLTRSYKAPTLAQLVPRPTLATGYPASGTNTATSPDSAGNPELKPELAWGLDLAYEHYLSDGGLFSISAFQRTIDNLIRNVTSLQSVDWSPTQRWVTAPENIGKARTRGIELEAKFRLSELMEGAPPLDLRINFSRFTSRVAGVPGPNNRLDQQPDRSANLGADYRLRGLPLTVGGNINWTPGFAVRQADTQYYTQGTKRVVDVYGLWKFDPNTQLRVSAANLLHADYDTENRYVDGATDQTAQTRTRTYRSLTARLEVKF